MSLVKDHGPASVFGNDPHIVCDQHDSVALGVHGREKGHQLLDATPVQASRWFVEDENLRMHDIDCRHAYLAAQTVTQQSRRHVSVRLQSKASQRLSHTLVYLLRRQTQVLRSKDYLLPHRGAENLMIGILKDIAHPTGQLSHRQVCCVLTADPHGSLCRL